MMTLGPALHATLVFEREIPAPITDVFAAFADPVVRAAWGAPSDTAVLIYDEADFREGGQDTSVAARKQIQIFMV